jgi:hypothetical protein
MKKISAATWFIVWNMPQPEDWRGRRSNSAQKLREETINAAIND